jgi:hypothetical protein
MKPIYFPGVNIVYGKDQKEYRVLPAIRMPDGEVITCWEFSEEEKEILVQTGKIYLQQLTFNQPIQPILPVVQLGDNLNIE